MKTLGRGLNFSPQPFASCFWVMFVFHLEARGEKLPRYHQPEPRAPGQPSPGVTGLCSHTVHVRIPTDRVF